MKDLSVMISSNLKWSCHISQIVSFALTCSYRILKSISGSNIWTLLTAYTADSMTYARSKLEYGIITIPWYGLFILRDTINQGDFNPIH